MPGELQRCIPELQTASYADGIVKHFVTMANGPDLPDPDGKLFRNPLLLLLSFVALIYALLAGLRTVTDPDLGWQMATGRWILLHHQIPSTDVFSYTAHGQPWIYPAGSGLLLYGTYLAGGYTLLSWLGAIACTLTVGLLLRRYTPMTAALAILAVPLIAFRTAPRAEMFTVVLFAAFLSILWNYLQRGEGKLWLLPLLMILWVNLHPGFIVGLLLTVVYGMSEAVRLLEGHTRQEVQHRFKRAVPWLLATWLATLLNPWGWNLFTALRNQQQATALHSEWINEWANLTVNWNTVRQGLAVRDPESAAFALLVAAAIAIVIAALRKQWTTAIVLCGSIGVALQHMRFWALFACVVVVVAAPVLVEGWSVVKAGITQEGLRKTIVAASVAALVLLAGVRSADLVSNRYYFGISGIASFGTGLSWWYPERAAAFLERENVPGQIFNTYNEGGYVVWRLGPKYPDYVDGRALPFGPQMFERMNQLVQTLPDSPAWMSEAETYDINAILVPLGRYEGLKFFANVLAQFCESATWRPFYLDEVSVVFVRVRPETQELIERHPVDCFTAPLPAPPPDNEPSHAFNHWANAAAVLLVLGRNQESIAASNSAIALFPGSASTYFVRAKAFKALGNISEADKDLRKAAELEDSPDTWSELAELYRGEGRLNEAIKAGEHLATLTPNPYATYKWLGYTYLGARRPNDALNAFDHAASSLHVDSSPPVQLELADLAHGRSSAWSALGDLPRAVSYQEEAVRDAPQVTSLWLQLANLYERQGRRAEAQQARARAAQTQLLHYDSPNQ